ncbi:MAG: hypothetical protein QOC55_2250 [Thermoleophilaceae bacterium]|nr:hypothetical protein [Thermoleophilaceae bacterium]
MRDNAAAARALRADEYESRFLRPVEVGEELPPRRREPRPRAYGSRQSGSGQSGSLQSAGPARLSASTVGIPGRRTVQITGQAAPPRRRSTTSTALVARPDRTALWAFLLALFLVLMAVATAHAAV